MCQLATAEEPIFSQLGGEPDLAEIVTMFVDEMPGRIATFLAECDARDWDALRRTVHQLRGAAGSYGFAAISPCAADVEEVLRSGAPEATIRDQVETLAEMCRRVRAGAPPQAATAG